MRKRSKPGSSGGAVALWSDPLVWDLGVPSFGDKAVLGHDPLYQSSDILFSAPSFIDVFEVQGGSFTLGGLGLSLWTASASAIGTLVDATALPGNASVGLVSGTYNFQDVLNVGFEAGGTGQLDVGALGGTATLDVQSALRLGVSGTGVMTITNGSSVSAGDHVDLGANTGASGSLTVDASTFSLVDNDPMDPVPPLPDQLQVGASSGTGFLEVRNGSTFSVAGVTFISLLGNQPGTVIVRDSGTTWVQLGQMNVRNGSLTIMAGATLTTGKLTSPTNSSGVIGGLNPSAGSNTLVMTDAGSQWTQDGAMSVGFVQAASATIQAGASLQSQEGFVGRFAGAGDVTITGSGSIWTVDELLSLGGEVGSPGSTGTLDVLSGGAVVVGERLHLEPAGSLDVSGGSAAVGTGATPLTGEVAVASDGRLSGSGAITGDVIMAGTLTPGSSPGTLSLGTLTLSSGATLGIDVEGTTAGTEYDVVAVTGTASLGGSLSVSVPQSVKPLLDPSDTFTILTSSGLSGAFTNAASGARIVTADGLASFRVDYPVGDAIVLSDFQNAPSDDSRWRQLGAGRRHNCGILASGLLACWGDDSAGQSSPEPGAFTNISTGSDANCALRVDGDLRCWGDPILTSPPDPSPEEFVMASVGEEHACGLLTDRSVLCWGNSADGRTTPPAGLLATQVTAGGAHSCARKRDGRVVCWGDDALGQASVALPTQQYQYVHAGDTHTCAIRPDGTVDCWGDSTDAKTTVVGGPVFEQLSVGDNHTCAVEPGGSVSCWGESDDGKTTPPGGLAFRSVHAGRDHTCGLLEDGRAVCWGLAIFGQVTPPGSLIPQTGAGAAHSCGLSYDLEPSCWGSNALGQLSHPAATFVRLASGTAHNCALMADGAPSCWGDSSQGQDTPPGGIEFSRVAAGGDASCAIRSDLSSAIECWGDMTYDQHLPPAGSFSEISLGDRHGCAIDSAGSLACWGDPASVNGKTTPPAGLFLDVASGAEHSCAVGVDGRIMCWGDDTFGQSQDQAERFTAVAAGGSHSCGILASGRLRCWGDPSDGRTSPPPGVYVSLAAGANHACAASVGGGFVCWGDSVSGQGTPVGDDDSDGITNGIDNCPLSANANQLDVDGDGAGDVCDVCPMVPDEDQRDFDDDGFGDRCDVCPEVYDPLQIDTDGDGFGDACEPPQVQLRPNSLVMGAATYDVSLDCGAFTVVEINFGVLIPGYDVGMGTPAVNFGLGAGCNATDCTGATALGTTVDPMNSSVQGPGLLSPVGIRDDALYFHLEGNPDLCTTGNLEFLATLSVDAVTSFDVLPPLTQEGLDLLSFDPVVDSGGGRPTTERLVGPAVFDTGVSIDPINGSSTLYALSLLSDEELTRARAAIVVPAGGTLSVLSYGPAVNGPASQTKGPVVEPFLRSDTVYLELVGARPTGGSPALNYQDLPEQVATLELTGSSQQPTLANEGVADAFVGDSFITVNASVIPIADIGQTFFTGGDDSDGDGTLDGSDNCPFVANDQTQDNGSFEPSLPGDGIGDACQCGDATADGGVTSADIAGLQDSLAGITTAESTLCSIAGGVECDILDVVVLDLALQGQGPGVFAVCGGAVGVSQIPEDP